MKHVRESLNQFNDYKFFKLFEEDEKAEKTELRDKEKDGLAVIEKLKKNFEDFKKDAKGEILNYKEFWEENKKTKEGFAEEGEGDVYKMFDSDYVVGVLTLPVSTLSDGSIDGGMGATDEPEEEIIEGKEITEPSEEKPAEDFYEEQTVPNPTNEAEEGEDDLDLDLGLEDDTEGEDLNLDVDVKEPAIDSEDDLNLDDTGTDDSGLSTEEPDMAEPDMSAPEETPDMGEPAPDLTAPQKYLVVYDTSGDQREEIFRTGSNNVIRDFEAFYNDTFKGSMKNAIIKYKEKKIAEKTEAEKAEKAKAETQKESKIKKFLSESQRNYLNAVATVSKLNEDMSNTPNADTQNKVARYLRKVKKSAFFKGTPEEAEEQFPDLEVVDGIRFDVDDSLPENDYLFINADRTNLSLLNRVYKDIIEKHKFIVIQAKNERNLNKALINRLHIFNYFND